MRGLIYRDLLSRYKKEKKADYEGVRILEDVNINTENIKPEVVYKDNKDLVVEAEENGEGIDVTFKADKKNHYGNSFDSAKDYENWLKGKDHNNVDQKRRAWIRNNIRKGNLDGKTLLSVSTEGRSHADGDLKQG